MSRSLYVIRRCVRKGHHRVGQLVYPGGVHLRLSVGLIAVGLAIALAVAGCSGGSSEGTTTSSTSSSVPEATTTSSTTTTSTRPPTPISVEIVEPPALTAFVASVDQGDGILGAPVRLAASVEIPVGERVEVVWASHIDGELGTGSVVDALLSNGGLDVVEHQVTVTITSSGGGLGSATVRVIVQVPSN